MSDNPAVPATHYTPHRLPVTTLTTLCYCTAQIKIPCLIICTLLSSWYSGCAFIVLQNSQPKKTCCYNSSKISTTTSLLPSILHSNLHSNQPSHPPHRTTQCHIAPSTLHPPPFILYHHPTFQPPLHTLSPTLYHPPPLQYSHYTLPDSITPPPLLDLLLLPPLSLPGPQGTRWLN